MNAQHECEFENEHAARGQFQNDREAREHSQNEYAAQGQFQYEYTAQAQSFSRMNIHCTRTVSKMTVLHETV
jgi:hypothetical protein